MGMNDLAFSAAADKIKRPRHDKPESNDASEERQTRDVYNNR